MHINPAVFFPTAIIAFAVILFSLIAPKASADLFAGLRSGAVAHFDWFFMMSGNLLLIFCVVVALSPLGKIRLGGKGATPDYSRLSWFAMLFGAGMGIGLVFYGVGEPVTHFTSSMAGGPAAPLGGAVGDAQAARSMAMAATIFDWALHPWAIFAVTGLALALFSFDFNMPLSMRSAFYPLFGKAVWGRTGDVIEVLAVLATIFGLATSLGLGAQQAMAGIVYLYGIANSSLTILALIAVMAGITFLSIRGGIDRGIRILSEVNMWVAFALLVFVLTTGSTLHCRGHDRAKPAGHLVANDFWGREHRANRCRQWCGLGQSVIGYTAICAARRFALGAIHVIRCHWLDPDLFRDGLGLRHAGD
jgi:BCCT family betaine/carnitine transporter